MKILSNTDKPPSRKVELGYLGTDLAFMSRVLRAHISQANADLYQQQKVEIGSVAILNLIGINPGISQNELASAVVVKKSAVTKIVSELEAQGLIERVKSNTDKRFNALHLTPAGAQKRDGMRIQMDAIEDTLMEPLTSIERDILFSMLGKIIDHMAKGKHS